MLCHFYIFTIHVTTLFFPVVSFCLVIQWFIIDNIFENKISSQSFFGVRFFHFLLNESFICLFFSKSHLQNLTCLMSDLWFQIRFSEVFSAPCWLTVRHIGQATLSPYMRYEWMWHSSATIHMPLLEGNGPTEDRPSYEVRTCTKPWMTSWHKIIAIGICI